MVGAGYQGDQSSKGINNGDNSVSITCEKMLKVSKLFSTSNKILRKVYQHTRIVLISYVHMHH